MVAWLATLAENDGLDGRASHLKLQKFRHKECHPPEGPSRWERLRSDAEHARHLRDQDPIEEHLIQNHVSTLQRRGKPNANQADALESLLKRMWPEEPEVAQFMEFVFSEFRSIPMLWRFLDISKKSGIDDCYIKQEEFSTAMRRMFSRTGRQPLEAHMSEVFDLLDVQSQNRIRLSDILEDDIVGAGRGRKALLKRLRRFFEELTSCRTEEMKALMNLYRSPSDAFKMSATGKVSRASFLEGLQRLRYDQWHLDDLFSRIDRDGSGDITIEDFLAFLKEAGPGGRYVKPAPAQTMPDLTGPHARRLNHSSIDASAKLSQLNDWFSEERSAQRERQKSARRPITSPSTVKLLSSASVPTLRRDLRRMGTSRWTVRSQRSLSESRHHESRELIYSYDPAPDLRSAMVEVVGKSVRVVDTGLLSIDELAGNVATQNDRISIALVKVSEPTSEPWLTLHYDEWMCVLKGRMVLLHGDASGTEYIPVCLPAFRPDRCIREEDADSDVSNKLQELHGAKTGTAGYSADGVPELAPGEDPEPDAWRHGGQDGWLDGGVTKHFGKQRRKQMWSLGSISDSDMAALALVFPAYFPPTFQADGFTHATAVPSRLLDDQPGEWICLRFRRSALLRLGIITKDEQAKPVGEKGVDAKAAAFVWPHVFGGIPPQVVEEVFPMERQGTAFVGILGLTKLKRVFKLATSSDVQRFKEQKHVWSDLDQKDGFVHLSDSSAAPNVARMFFANVEDLMILEIDAEKIPQPAKWIQGKMTDPEPTADVIHYLLPEGCVHVYGSERIVPWEAVARCEAVPWKDRARQLRDDGLGRFAVTPNGGPLLPFLKPRWEDLGTGTCRNEGNHPNGWMILQRSWNRHNRRQSVVFFRWTMSSRSSVTLLNKEALEESQGRLLTRIADLLKQQQVAIEKKLEHFELEVRACSSELFPGSRLKDTRKSVPPVAAGDTDGLEPPASTRQSLHLKKGMEELSATSLAGHGGGRAKSMKVSLGMLPEDFQSEASGVSNGPSSGVTDGTNSYGLDVAEGRPKKAASRNRDLEIMQGQLKMAAMKSMKRGGSRQGHQDMNRTSGRSGKPHRPSQSMEDDGGASKEAMNRRKSIRQSIRSEISQAVTRSKGAKKTLFSHAHDESAQLREYARNLHNQKAIQNDVSGGSMGMADTCRSRLRRVVSSIPFEAVAGCIIITNAVIIGLEVEYMAVNRAYRSPDWFQSLHLLYAIVFALEFALRLIAYGWDLYTDSDLFRWACLDCFIVVSSFVDLALAWEMRAKEQEMSGTASSGMSAIRVMRVLRISRLIRVTRIAKLMMWLKALRTLIHSIFVTLKSLVWALVLLALIMYVFAIMLSSAAIDRLVDLQELPRDAWSASDLALEGFWGSMGDAVSTLFMSITGGISWQIAETPLMGLFKRHDHNPKWKDEVKQQMVFLKVVFMLYISFTMFAVLNVMTGVFCQSAIESAARDHDMAMQNVMADKQAFTRKFLHLFRMLDQDDTGLITLVELEERMEDLDVKTYFEALELSIDDVWTFFRLLDGDDGQEIDVEEFLYGCMRLRGEAKALDLAKLMHSHAWLAKQQVDFMMFCEEKFVQLQYYLAEGLPCRQKSWGAQRSILHVRRTVTRWSCGSEFPIVTKRFSWDSMR
eukprot:s696_g12.t1